MLRTATRSNAVPTHRKIIESRNHIQANHFQKHRFSAHILFSRFLCPSGLRTGDTLWVISDNLSVRTFLEVKTAGMGVLAITLRAEQTPKTSKFGIKNGISGAKKVLLKMIHL